MKFVKVVSNVDELHSGMTCIRCLKRNLNKILTLKLIVRVTTAMLFDLWTGELLRIDGTFFPPGS